MNGAFVTLENPAFSIAELRSVEANGFGVIDSYLKAQIDAEFAGCVRTSGNVADNVHATINTTHFMDAQAFANTWLLDRNCCRPGNAVVNCANDTVVKVYKATVAMTSTDGGSLDVALRCAPVLANLAASGKRRTQTDWVFSGWGIVETVPTWKVCENQNARRAALAAH